MPGAGLIESTAEDAALAWLERLGRMRSPKFNPEDLIGEDVERFADETLR